MIDYSEIKIRHLAQFWEEEKKEIRKCFLNEMNKINGESEQGRPKDE